MGPAITQFTSIVNHIITYIVGSPILMTMFAGGLFIVGAKIFKKIRKAVK